jgi:hypothetical protein
MSFANAMSSFSLTYTCLQEHFSKLAEQLRDEIVVAEDSSDIAQANRVCEILLMGMRLCDEEMGTPEQINTLVDQRVQEIVHEERPFSPDPLDIYRVPELPIRSNAIYEDETATSPAASNSNSPDEVAAAMTRSLDLGSPSFHEKYRSRLVGPDQWDKLHKKLLDWKSRYVAGYKFHGNVDFDYAETIDALETAMAVAALKSDCIDTDKVWSVTEYAVKMFKDTADARREALQPSTVDPEGSDEDEGKFKFRPTNDQPHAHGTYGLDPFPEPSVVAEAEQHQDNTNKAIKHDTDNGTRRNADLKAQATPEPAEESPKTYILDVQQAEEPSRAPSPSPQSATFIFDPLLTSTTPISSLSPDSRAFYRRAVEQTLDALLNATLSTDVSSVISAYWTHVEHEVPTPTLTEEEHE